MAGEGASGGPGSGSGGVSGTRAARFDLVAAALVAAVVLALAVLVVQARERQAEQAAVDRAAAAFAAADQAEARTWANDAWVAAQTAVDVAMADLHAQDSSPLFVRSYARTTALLARAITAADTARTAAESARREWESENRHWESAPARGSASQAQAANDRVKAAIDGARNFIAELEKCRRKPRDFKKDLEDARGVVAGFGSKATDLEGMYERADYDGVQAQADSLKGQLDMLIADMQAAKTKLKC
jgi:hypothetical protein